MSFNRQAENIDMPQTFSQEQVILVDEKDNAIGTCEKLAAHQQNLRHRAFSVFVYRTKPHFAILLQQRAHDKYHCGNLWTNTCCSHPRPNEEIIAAGERRLQEEMGISVKLLSLGWFHYIAPFSNGLTENENDYVLVGNYENEEIYPDATEVQNYRWITLSELQSEIAKEPEKFTPWLSLALPLVIKEFISK